MLRTIRAATTSDTTETNNTSHFTRQAAISPAVTIFQKPSGQDLFSTSTAINSPTKVANIEKPTTKANAARPKDGSSCSALASGGPMARAPHEGQPRQRSTETPEPQRSEERRVGKECRSRWS